MELAISKPINTLKEDIQRVIQVTEDIDRETAIYFKGLTEIDLLNVSTADEKMPTEGVIEITGFSIFYAEVADDETGEVKKMPCTKLVLSDGKVFSTISSGIFKSIMNIAIIVDFDSKNVLAEISTKKLKKGEMRILKVLKISEKVVEDIEVV